jgi:hypothetical protein
MEYMASEKSPTSGADGEPVRRRGDRRTQDQAVADDRRKGDRRTIPGVSALIRTLFRRGPTSES